MTEQEEGWIHRTDVQVQFDEVDQYGIVHHTKYFIYFERARVQLMGLLGMRADLTDGLGLIVAGIDAKFRASARFLDRLVVEQGSRKVGASRIELSYRISRDHETICTALLVLAFVAEDGRPCRAPDHIREGLKRMGDPEAAR